MGPALGLAAPAQAHNYLVSSMPAADSTLTELPDEFDITTNDDLLMVGEESLGFALQVRDAAGLYYGDGCVTIDGPTMSATPPLGEPGRYTVLWQVVSADGHTVSDEFVFEWAPSGAYLAPGAEAATGMPAPPECGAADASGSGTEPTEESGDVAADSGAGDSSAGAPAPEPPTSDAAPAASTDALWIGGAGLALVTAVVVVLLVTRRARRQEAAPTDD